MNVPIKASEPVEAETWRGWQPVRLPWPGQWSRARGLPEIWHDTVKIDLWCQTHCRERWHRNVGEEGEIVYWFENAADAAAFAISWFPFKCT